MDENVEAETRIVIFFFYFFFLRKRILRKRNLYMKDIRIIPSLIFRSLLVITIFRLAMFCCWALLVHIRKPVGGGGGGQSSGSSNGLPVSSPVPPTPRHCATSQCPCQYIQNHLYNKANPAPNVCWKMPNFGFH